MNILVLGNGFDLAHGLPTTYQDFLKFTDNYRNFLENDYYEQMLEVKKMVDDNIWIKHFKRFYEGNGWIGFEKEISDIIKILDKKVPEFEKISERGAGSVKFNLIEQDALKDFDLSITQGIVIDKNFIPTNKDRMLCDLNRLIRCLEIYLDCCINHYSVKKLSPDIEELDIDKVLSFNYTNTYARIYGNRGKNNIEYDYIHGKADIDHDIETNNMVLGIDEYLSDDRKNKDIDFIAFKKYYQRIYKQTGCKYKEWVDKIRQDYLDYSQKIENAKYKELQYIPDTTQRLLNKHAMSAIKHEKCPKHNLYIFGHSLDVTDKDVLRDLILNDNVYTTIFYHNKDVMGQQIANLVKVIGQDELIRRTGGGTKIIEFNQQQDMVNI